MSTLRDMVRAVKCIAARQFTRLGANRNMTDVVFKVRKIFVLQPVKDIKLKGPCSSGGGNRSGIQAGLITYWQEFLVAGNKAIRRG